MKLHKFSSIVLIFSILIIFGCGENKRDYDIKDSDTSSTKTNESKFSAEMTAGIDSVLNQAMLNDSIPGISGGIWIKDKGSTTFNKGVSDLSTQKPRELTDYIRIGSITKTFIGTVFLQLCDEGKIALNDKLDKYYPQVPNAKDITMRELLNMTSGLQDYLNAPELDNAFFYERLKEYTDDEILNIAIKLPPMFPPGEPGKYHYSNTNYLLLGMIIDKVTNGKWQNEIVNRIIKKLGLKNTIVPVTPDMPEPYCHGYMKDSTGKVEDATKISPTITGAAGCMISTIGDLTVYVKALDSGELLSDTMQAERLKTIPTGTAPFLGYGLAILKIGSFYGHNGGITGFNTSMYYSPELDAMFILNVNMFGPTGGVADRIFSSLAEVIYPGQMPWDKKKAN